MAAAQGTIFARRNLFAAGVTPATVVSDPGGNLDLANPLTGNAAFVADLYEDLLRRAADTTSPTDAAPLVSALNAGLSTLLFHRVSNVPLMYMSDPLSATMSP